MNLWIKLKPQSFLGHRTARIILGFNHHQKIVNMLLSTRQTRRWAFILKLWNVIEISTRAMDSNKRDMYSRWMNRFMFVYKRIGKNCAHEKHDKHSQLSRESKYWCWLDRGSLHWNSVTLVVRQKKKKRGPPLYHTLVRSITAWLRYLLIILVTFIQAKEGRPCVRSTCWIWPSNWLYKATKTTQLWAHGIRWCWSNASWVAW